MRHEHEEFNSEEIREKAKKHYHTIEYDEDRIKHVHPKKYERLE